MITDIMARDFDSLYKTMVHNMGIHALQSKVDGARRFS